MTPVQDIDEDDLEAAKKQKCEEVLANEGDDEKGDEDNVQGQPRGRRAPRAQASENQAQTKPAQSLLIGFDH